MALPAVIKIKNPLYENEHFGFLRDYDKKEEVFKDPKGRFTLTVTDNGDGTDKLSWQQHEQIYPKGKQS